ncbi:MAG: hypothetical protein EXX96DRAFT_553195 [Benjaminiella poitrasii]|nr:MAG: hypothetical protein EXX96DRAFT_553195 [Benjaminiella poitrasii]
MTRYTKMKRKTFVKSDDAFKVTPLLPRNNEGQDGRFNSNNQRSRNDGFNKGKGGMKRRRDDNDAYGNNKKNKKEVCFACRKPGHSVNRCPQNKEHANICYNCGSTEHRLKDCRKSRKGSKLQNLSMVSHYQIICIKTQKV